MPWVKIADATESSSKFIKKTKQFIKEEGVCRSVIVNRGDLILSNSGTAGLAKFMDITACIHDGWQVLKDLDGITKEYLYYTLVYLRPILLHNAYDSTMKNLTLDQVRDAEIKLPPPPEQKRIAHILGTLDDKIELNRKMNATLEAMAQALFKSWFVDFDPVIDNALRAGNPIPEPLQQRAETRRKILGERSSSCVTTSKDGAGAPSLPDPHSHLFPATFTHSEDLGWIPEGWETSTFGKAVTIVGGGTPSTKNSDFWNDGIHYWSTPKDFSSLTTKIMLGSSRKITDAGLAKLSSGLLPIDSVLMSSRAPIGYMAINKVETAINQGFIGMICDQGLPAEYMIYCTDSRMDDIKGAASGSTFAEISKKTFKSLPMLNPAEGALKVFTQLTQENHNKIHSTLESTTTLTKLRDTLLPKLISGELRLAEAEHLTENAIT